MKKVKLITQSVLLILLFTNVIYGQTMQSDLNQADLMKQFIGTWKNDINKDTVFTAEFKPFGNNGLEFSLRGVSQGKVWLDMKQLWGYDKKSNKVLIAGFMKDSPGFMLQASSFTAKNRYEQVPYESASDPDKAAFKVIFDLKAPDLVLREEIVNGKSLGVEKYVRVK
jgi:hypothetical protein